MKTPQSVHCQEAPLRINRCMHRGRTKAASKIVVDHPWAWPAQRLSLAECFRRLPLTSSDMQEASLHISRGGIKLGHALHCASTWARACPARWGTPRPRHFGLQLHRTLRYLKGQLRPLLVAGDE